MNIPSGKQIVSKLNIREIDAKTMLSDLLRKKFNGYICITVNGSAGFEDGILILELGAIKGCHYKLLQNNKNYYAESALKLFLNSYGAEFGTIDVYGLTKEQVDLILTFNEKVKIKDITDINSIADLFVSHYNSDLTLNKDVKKSVSKYDLLKSIGLGNTGL